jgi:dTDP-glucose 4,6-dehydratase
VDLTSSTPVGHLPVPWRDLKGRRIFLTGGTGFFGCNLLEAYTKAWDRERLGGLISVLTRGPAAFRLKAPHLAEHPGVETLEGDLTNCDFGDSSWDLLIHTAVEYGEPLDLLERNLQATRRMLELARGWGARRVLFTSSGAVYGPQPPNLSHLVEEFGGAPPRAAASAYGEAKRASELLGLLHGERHGYEFLIARGFAFLGPWLPLEGFSAVGNFIGDALAGRPIQVNGDGRPYRSYLYGEDLADWLWTILLRGVHGRPYNVGSGKAISIGDLAHRVRDLLAPEREVRIALKPGQGLPPRYVPSVERARQELGLEPRVGLDEAILRTADWNRERH